MGERGKESVYVSVCVCVGVHLRDPTISLSLLFAPNTLSQDYHANFPIHLCADNSYLLTVAGGAEMEGEILQHMNIPPSTIREPQRFQHFIYLTRV